ncbi:MAG: HAMP domain-containing histidine kinase [Gammaproteobacteria bacterium]|nr:HAMP domain-containing histidine kinase [Gammaproteobacteria bacterium]
MAPEASRSLAARCGALLRTSTFQLTLFYTGLFSLSAALLAMFFYWSTIGLLVRETDATLKAEITGLAEQYIEHGLERLVQVIVHRIRNDQSGAMIYLFATRDNQPLAGNLLEWPRIEADVDGWVEFTHHRADGRDVPARARVYLLGDGLHLLVGRNIEQLRQLKQVFNRALLLGVGVIFVLATGGGLLMSNRMLKRVGAMTAATGDIIAGQLDRRLEIRGVGDEFDELASRVNIMLDRLQALLATVRHVSDNIAHDLRTPLTRLRNRIELAAREAPEALRDELEASVEDADQLLATFAALLRIARIESGSYDAEVEVLDLGTLINDANELYLGVAQDKQLSLQAEVHGQPLVRGDRNLLFQALTNLLDNAIKHSPAGAVVKVDVRTAGPDVVVEVRDAGPGIPLEERERVTQRFTRLDQSRSLPGSGLGLSLVKAVAELHKGSLGFSDNAPGLCASLRLPAA